MSNAEMAQYWNDGAGPVWTRYEEMLDAQLGPIGAQARTRLALRPGERVLDVGCGCGATTLELAQDVGAKGRVVAVDISRPMLDRARARADAAGFASRSEFRLEDAQTAPFEPASFDALFSRFGVMFFDDPGAAFTNLRRALRPGGRMTFVCWQDRRANPWMMAPALAAAQHIEFPAPPPPDAPGPFAFADDARVRSILEGAGFANVETQAVNASMRIGGASLDETLELMLAIGPVGAAMREAKPSEEQAQRVIAAVREVLKGFQTPRGVEAPAAWWIVSARNPS